MEERHWIRGYCERLVFSPEVSQGVTAQGWNGLQGGVSLWHPSRKAPGAGVRLGFNCFDNVPDVSSKRCQTELTPIVKGADVRPKVIRNVCASVAP